MAAYANHQIGEKPHELGLEREHVELSGVVRRANVVAGAVTRVGALGDECLDLAAVAHVANLFAATVDRQSRSSNPSWLSWRMVC